MLTDFITGLSLILIQHHLQFYVKQISFNICGIVTCMYVGFTLPQATKALREIRGIALFYF